MEKLLNKMVKLQSAFKKLHNDGGIIGITDSYIQLDSEAFREFFPKHDTSDFVTIPNLRELSTTYKGVKFLAVVDKED